MLGVERHESQIANLENWLVRAPSGPMRDISSRETTLLSYIPYALSLIIPHSNGSLPILKLHFELSMSVYVLSTYHISFAAYQPRNLTDHIASSDADITGLLG